MTRIRRLTTAVAGLVVAAMALSGCLYAAIPAASSRTPSASAPAPDTDGVPDDLLPYYGQTLDWSSCADGFECTTVTAPLDWTDPSKGDIELALTRHPAGDGQPLGSLFMNPGGPGESGVDFLQTAIDTAFDAALIDQFDTVSFDPRGVGKSTAVKCLDTADMDAFLFDLPASPRGTDAWTAEVVQSQKKFADACEANSGGILPYVTTVNSAKDLDLLRAVMGETTLDYLGYSYGTFLGATYAGLFPDKVGRFVLDGALDPTVANWDVGATQFGGFESNLRAYLAQCVAGSDCPFSGTVDQATADVQTLLATVQAQPLTNTDGRKLDGSALVQAILTALYSADSWPYLTQALSAVLQGDPSIAFSLVDIYYSREGGRYTNNTYEAFSAYECMDYPRETADDMAAYNAKVAQVAPTFAPYLIGPDSCAVWPYEPTGERGAITAQGAPPIVVLGTTNDPATPYVWSQGLADQLDSGVLVTRVGDGHTGYNKGNTCIDDAIDAFFLSDTVPEDGLTCQ